MSLSFGLNNSRDCLEAFREQVSRFRSDSLSLDLAFSCAAAGWSVCDWVFDEHGASLGYPRVIELKNALKKECHELGYLQDVDNARKHKKITNYRPLIEKAYEHRGAFSSGFSRAFDISRLMLTTQDGKQVWFEDALVVVLEFWDGFFARHNL